MKTIFFLFSFLFFIASCGKSPLQMKKSSETVVITGLESAKKFKLTNHVLYLQWLSPVNSTDEGHALLIVTKNQLAADLPESFSLFLWMPTMGHGSSPVKIKKIGTGLYDLSSLYFIMDGLWQIRVQLKSNGQVLEEQTFEINL